MGVLNEKRCKHVKLQPKRNEEIHGNRSGVNGRGLFRGIKHCPRRSKDEIRGLEYDLELGIRHDVAVYFHRILNHVVIGRVQETGDEYNRGVLHDVAAAAAAPAATAAALTAVVL